MNTQHAEIRPSARHPTAVDELRPLRHEYHDGHGAVGPLLTSSHPRDERDLAGALSRDWPNG
jgi:hypothetical protein